MAAQWRPPGASIALALATFISLVVITLDKFSCSRSALRFELYAMQRTSASVGAVETTSLVASRKKANETWQPACNCTFDTEVDSRLSKVIELKTFMCIILTNSSRAWRLSTSSLSVLPSCCGVIVGVDSEAETYRSNKAVFEIMEDRARENQIKRNEEAARYNRWLLAKKRKMRKLVKAQQLNEQLELAEHNLGRLQMGLDQTSYTENRLLNAVEGLREGSSQIHSALSRMEEGKTTAEDEEGIMGVTIEGGEENGGYNDGYGGEYDSGYNSVHFAPDDGSYLRGS
eukprot:jgi/Bigna1/82897/fgenesh1_pg.99_\